ncbi:MAG: PEP/pyruvate-binding domain-containing protein [Bacteroidota bacterium]
MADVVTRHLLVPGAAAPDASAWGGKGAALAELVADGLAIPPFVVIAAEAFDALVPSPAREALARQEAAALEVPDELADLVDAALAELGHSAFVAVRSSAPDEDGAAQAFAGQLESFLFVPPDQVAAKVVDVWRSAFAEHVFAYREAHQLQGPPKPPAVVIQAMVDADVSGVAFGADPVTGDESVAVVAAVVGLASALVDGRADAETVRVDGDGEVVSREPGRQLVADRPAPGGGVDEVAVEVVESILSSTDAKRIAELARDAGAKRGSPQDIEWAIADSTLWLLQSRPITTLASSTPSPQSAAHDSRIRLWDNSNIIESYSGVTTPLTYSFARRAYEAVYREFCRLLRVPEDRIEAESETFAQMIGLIRGRVYYNLGNWYRVLALLPGYRLNARLMEGMMGVKEPIPPHLQPAPPSVGKLRDGLDLVRTAFGLFAAHRRLPRMKADFYQRVDRALGASGPLDDLSLDELVSVYRQLERELLTKWDAPLVNDFFAMIAFGLAQKTAESWIGPGALGPLLAGDGDVISAEPARRVRHMAEAIHRQPDLVAAFQTEVPDNLMRHLEPELRASLDDYLERFGDRCLDELKLESPTLNDDPAPLLRSIGATAERMARGEERDEGVGLAIRSEGEGRADDALKGHLIRRFVFQRLVQWARVRVRDRENLRFERTRVFGRARRLVLAMGQRLTEAGRLDDARDVFFLEIDELLGAADGYATTSDLAGLAVVRQRVFEGYHQEAAPPDRFITRGAVALSLLEPAGATAAADGESRTGLGCCAGIVEGSVRVVRDPRGVTLEPGTILVAERTDPGWILLFPSCAGLVVERGSLLSHSAIVARELGIPCAVSVPEATAWLQDGDRVRLDGAAGTVERLSRAPDA